ncbi:MAG: glycosyltransferase family 4 protein [Sphingopyxis sp.]|nr:glycosyltransferase family 4 protein [Sphingopyxis sp.]
MKIAIIYDCLFPWTIGGAERWLRDLAEGLAKRGHEVSYITLQQWDKDAPPHIPGVEVIAVGPRLDLYRDGKRRIWPPLCFGIGVFWYLLTCGHRYDRVHLCSFPYFALLAAALLWPLQRYSLSVDWFEVWTRDYWRDYLGRIGGRIGWWVQKLCAKTSQTPHCFSRVHAARLREIRGRDDVLMLSGLYNGAEGSGLPVAAVPPTLVYAGRMIPEKRVPLFVEAMALAVREEPALRATIFGRGPELAIVEARIAELGLTDIVALPGFVAEEVVTAAMDGATAIVQPSGREGYGLVIVEASARGVPAVVIDGPDNSAVELVDADVNGFVAAEPTPPALAEAMLAAVRGGDALRERTREWWNANRRRLSIESSIAAIDATL